jgi:hypothetical protein
MRWSCNCVLACLMTSLVFQIVSSRSKVTTRGKAGGDDADDVILNDDEEERARREEVTKLCGIVNEVDFKTRVASMKISISVHRSIGQGECDGGGSGLLLTQGGS